MRTVVVSLGGSMLFAKAGVDTDYLKRITALFKKLHKDTRLAVVTGGGLFAREYSNSIREAGGSEFLADRAAILATKANATMLIAALGDAAYPKIIQDPDDAAVAIASGKIPVGCGILEGVTTDFDSMLIAERLGADALVNLSNTEAVYTADPKKDRSAKKLAKMTHQQLVDMASLADQRRAGTHFVFDVVACKVAARAGIELHFVNGRDLKQVEHAILGKPHQGTIVKD
ncbi:MAG: UMP kinase [Candidatus Micrarchaeota archaeon]